MSNGWLIVVSALAVGAGTMSASMAGCAVVVDRSTVNGTGGAAGGGGGAGGAPGCATPSDCGEKTSCTTYTCNDGLCAETYAAQATECSDGQANVCDRAGDGCLCDGAGTCVPPNCVDTVQNGDETDVDCGGSCPPCTNGDDCLDAKDCESGFCDKDQGTGGGGFGGSAGGAGGAGGSAGGAGLGDTGGGGTGGSPQGPGVCANCSSHANCTELDDEAYCSAGTCELQLDDGEDCNDFRQCQSGFCSDGVCCDTACAGGCDACSVADGADADGECTILPIGDAGDPGCEPYLCDGTNAACPTTCDAGGDCASGNCEGGICCDMNCGECSVCDADGVGCVAVADGFDADDCDNDSFSGSCTSAPCECQGGSCQSDPRVVFLSSITYANGADVGSVAMADADCNSLATAASLPGTFKAWLSDTDDSPDADFVKSAIPYVLVTGVKVADDYTDLTDGTLDAVINHDENGTMVAPASSVWTGTQANGMAAANHCVDWTSMSSANLGVFGSNSETDTRWSASTTTPCDSAGIRIYCFEQ